MVLLALLLGISRTENIDSTVSCYCVLFTLSFIWDFLRLSGLLGFFFESANP